MNDVMKIYLVIIAAIIAIALLVVGYVHLVIESTLPRECKVDGRINIILHEGDYFILGDQKIRLAANGLALIGEGPGISWIHSLNVGRKIEVSSFSLFHESVWIIRRCTENRFVVWETISSRKVFPSPTPWPTKGPVKIIP